MISGDSNIILEGAIHNKSIIYIPSAKVKEVDYYGFLQNKIIDYQYSSQYDLIKNFINDYPFPKICNHNSLKRYNHSINTSFENKTSNFISNLIVQLAKGIDLDKIPQLTKKENYYEIQ